MNDEMKRNIEQVFEELSKLSNAEFWEEIEVHKDTPRAKAIEYALSPNGPIKVFDEKNNVILYYASKSLYDMVVEFDTEFYNLSMADFIIDCTTGNFIKARYPLDVLVDHFYSKNP